MKLSVDFMIETFWNSLSAVPVTLKLTFIPLLLALPISFFLALAQVNKVKFWGKFSSLYVSFVRGTPTVVLILLIYNTLPGRLARFFKSIGSDFNVYRSIPSIAYAYFVFTVTATAALIEIIRSALGAVNKGQLEAAYSIGLSPFAAYRRIILPQALRAAVPNLTNLVVVMVKTTSLAFMMTVTDIMQTAKKGAALNYKYTESYIVILLMYIVICLILQGLFGLLEKRVGRFAQRTVS